MTSNEDLRQFHDPLMGDIDNFRASRNGVAGARNSVSRDGKSGRGFLLLGGVLAGAVALLGFYLHDAQQRVARLSQELTSSQASLEDVQEDLGLSRDRLDELSGALEESREQISLQRNEIGRYRAIVQDLKSDQDSQGREIRSLDASKADVQEISKIRQDTTELQSRIGTAAERLEQAQQEIARLDAVSKEHGDAISRNRSGLEVVGTTTARNSDEIGTLRRSLEREYYNFELQEGAGYLKVFEVSLNLKDADVEKRQYDLYVVAGGKVLRKKDQSVDEPILFYLEGQAKPYEIVVTRIDRKTAVGYLSVPRS